MYNRTYLKKNFCKIKLNVLVRECYETFSPECDRQKYIKGYVDGKIDDGPNQKKWNRLKRK